MALRSQLALPLADGDEGQGQPARIVIGAANESAARALAEPGAWPFRTAVLSGAPRSGKSLLARWFARTHTEAQVLDEAHTLPEPEVFHAWNRAQEGGTPLLLIAGAEEWAIALPDLRSRLTAALHLQIEEPDDTLLAALLEAHAERRRLVLGADAATYLVPRIERSFAAVERVVAEIDRLSLERKVAPGRSIWRDALDAVQGPRQPPLL